MRRRRVYSIAAWSSATPPPASHTAVWTRDVLVCLGAYVYGSLPLVYLLGRRARVDLTRVGSGNVGATNLQAIAGTAPALLGWTFDASKGFVPVAGARLLGCGQEVAGLAGVCGVAGQCWPVFLRFNGGRGISAFVGAAAAVNARAWGVAILPMVIGGLWRKAAQMPLWLLSQWSHAPRRSPPLGRSKSVPLGCFVGAVTFPVACRLFASPESGTARVVGSAVPSMLSGVVLMRRLTAPQPDDATYGPIVRPVALLCRLLFDRNTSR